MKGSPGTRATPGGRVSAAFYVISGTILIRKTPRSYCVWDFLYKRDHFVKLLWGWNFENLPEGAGDHTISCNLNPSKSPIFRFFNLQRPLPPSSDNTFHRGLCWTINIWSLPARKHIFGCPKYFGKCWEKMLFLLPQDGMVLTLASILTNERLLGGARIPQGWKFMNY